MSEWIRRIERAALHTVAKRVPRQEEARWCAALAATFALLALRLSTGFALEASPIAASTVAYLLGAWIWKHRLQLVFPQHASLRLDVLRMSPVLLWEGATLPIGDPLTGVVLLGTLGTVSVANLLNAEAAFGHAQQGRGEWDTAATDDALSPSDDPPSDAPQQETLVDLEADAEEQGESGEPEFAGESLSWRHETDEFGAIRLADLEGTLQVVLPAQTRLVVRHVPFWPPMSASPEVECELLDASDVRIRVAETRRWGARLELRCAAAQPHDRLVTISLSVRASANCQRRAA